MVTSTVGFAIPLDESDELIIRQVKTLKKASKLRLVQPLCERIEVHIIQDGKEAGQGVGYLEDGTMVVVEGGNRLIDRTMAVTVTKVLQTTAGRMIFARPQS